ncbi:hypothetical protein ABGB07_36315 [Micromonosporaceae bacterium B7E4]
MDTLVIALCALAGVLGGFTGAACCWLVLNHRVESMHATVRATVLATPAERLERVSEHRAGWRAAIHLPHRRAAA